MKELIEKLSDNELLLLIEEFKMVTIPEDAIVRKLVR